MSARAREPRRQWGVGPGVVKGERQKQERRFRRRTRRALAAEVEPPPKPAPIDWWALT